MWFKLKKKALQVFMSVTVCGMFCIPLLEFDESQHCQLKKHKLVSIQFFIQQCCQQHWEKSTLQASEIPYPWAFFSLMRYLDSTIIGHPWKHSTLQCQQKARDLKAAILWWMIHLQIMHVTIQCGWLSYWYCCHMDSHIILWLINKLEPKGTKLVHKDVKTWV